MENICRLCLGLSFENSTVLTDSSDLLATIRSCLLLPITIDKSLPYKLCQKCEQKLLDFYNFLNIIIQNEAMLQKYSRSDNLSDFYKNIYDNKVKDENTNFDNKENLVNRICDETGSNDKTDSLIKEEILLSKDGFDIAVETSSDDNVTLSNLKSVKESKVRPKKESKKKQTYKPSRSNDSLFFPEGIKWKCLTCFDLFDVRQSLLNHYKEKHYKENENGRLDENNMNKKFSVISIDGCEKYKCSKCEMVFDKRKFIMRHMVKHIEDRPFVCNICGRTYREVSDIMRHGRVHSGFKPLICSYEQCGFSTSYYGALRTHEKRHCPEFKYTCEQCGKGFHVSTWYEQHQNKHTGEKPYVCDICGSAHSMDKYLKVHRKSMHPEATNQKRHICIHCGLSCDNRTALNAHFKEHGIIKSYLCDVCGKSFSNSHLLKFHTSTHLGVKPHSCSTCGKAFVRKSNLALHLRTHSGERPHICSHCGKGFTQRSTLVLHTRGHTGVRPYQCSLCPKAFISRSKLLAHQKTCP